VVRRLLASLLLATGVLGIVQPAFACASPSDCCPTGTTRGCGGENCEAAGWIATHSCCATRAISPSSVSIRARPVQLQPHASGAPVTADLAAVDSLPRDRNAWTPLPCVIANTVFDGSLTYLSTARLRL
jgi:hypothetical protein